MDMSISQMLFLDSCWYYSLLSSIFYIISDNAAGVPCLFHVDYSSFSKWASVKLFVYFMYPIWELTRGLHIIT